MKPAVPLLAPILRSNSQGDLLAALFLQPDTEWTPTSLSNRLKTSLPTVLREVDRMVKSGFLLERRVGRARLISANRAHALYHPLVQILEYAYGPLAVLPSILSGVPGIEDAFIYGSWAARHEGIGGSDPADIDVIVVGVPDRLKLADAADEASRRCGREVNIRAVSPALWQDDNEYFIRTIKNRPMLQIDLERRTAS